MPAYLTRFACIGSACEDTCCAGYTVDVDAETYARYQQLPPKGESDPGETLRRYLRRRPPTSQTSAAFAVIELLTAERLCGVQAELGEDLLSNSCATYPRTVVQVDGAVQLAATLSCPEAARLALLDPDALTQVESPEQVPVRPTPARTYRLATAFVTRDDLRRHLRLIQELIVSLLCRRDLGLESRLIALGLALEWIAAQGNAPADQVRAAFDIAPATIEAVRRRALAQPGRRQRGLLFLLGILGRRLGDRPVPARYRRCLDRLQAGLQVDVRVRPSDPRISMRAFAAARRAFYDPYVCRHPHVLENLLVNDVLAQAFPFGGGRPLLDEYALFVARFALIRLHLVGMAAFAGGLDHETVVEVVQSFERHGGTASSYETDILGPLRGEACINVERLAVLVLDSAQ
jgi:lysine-N-methylase